MSAPEDNPMDDVPPDQAEYEAWMKGEHEAMEKARTDERRGIECDECGTVYEPMTDAYRCPLCGASNYPQDESL